MKRFALLCIPAALMMAAMPASMSKGDLIANFTDGAGNTLSDQFPGTLGGGWLGGWEMDGNGSVGTVTDGNPLNGGGNYLSIDAPNPGGGGNRTRWVRRQIGDFDISTMPHTVKFDFRPEVGLSGETINNRYHMFGSTSPGSNTSSASTWIAMAAVGDLENDTPMGHVAGNWGFLAGTDGTTVSFAGTNFIDTGIPLVAGTTYSFELLVDPVTRSYKPSITDGTTSFSSPNFLPFRNQGDGVSTVAAQWLNFAKRFNEENLNLNVGFSLDNLSVSAATIDPNTPGDFNGDGNVDGADFVIWQINFPNNTGTATLDMGDANGDGSVDGADFVVWQTNFPTTAGSSITPVPEPGAFILAAIGLVGCLRLRRLRA